MARTRYNQRLLRGIVGLNESPTELPRARYRRKRSTLYYHHITHGHHTYSAKAAPIAPPINQPNGAAIAGAEKIMLFFFPEGYVLPPIASAFGSRNAGSIPCSARAASKEIGEWVKALQPPMMGQTPSQAHPSISMRFEPYRSPSFPAMRMNVPTVRL
ncbi:hypothetical protein BDV12DRAFT_28086 [Aspergillus spectabilis]